MQQINHCLNASTYLKSKFYFFFFNFYHNLFYFKEFVQKMDPIKKEILK